MALVESVNEIGHVMGKQTIVEFVEDQEILDELSKIGVDYVQGYYLGMPKLLSELNVQCLEIKKGVLINTPFFKF